MQNLLKSAQLIDFYEIYKLLQKNLKAFYR